MWRKKRNTSTSASNQPANQPTTTTTYKNKYPTFELVCCTTSTPLSLKAEKNEKKKIAYMKQTDLELKRGYTRWVLCCSVFKITICISESVATHQKYRNDENVTFFFSVCSRKKFSQNWSSGSIRSSNSIQSITNPPQVTHRKLLFEIWKFQISFIMQKICSRKEMCHESRAVRHI